MANMVTFVQNDDSNPLITHTFVPVTDTPNPYWRGSNPVTPLEGQVRLTASVEQQKNGSYKITTKLEVPVMETLGASGSAAGYVAPPKVAYTNVAIFTMFADRRSTIADRANLYKIMLGLLAGATATVDQGTLNGASVADTIKNSTRQIPQLYTSVLVPN